MRIRIHLDNGPLEKQSIAETYPGATRPPHFRLLMATKPYV